MGQIFIENEADYPVFKKKTVEHYNPKGRKLVGVRMKMISHDEEYAKRVKAGTAIDITNPEFEMPKTGRKTIDGIFTPLFGPDSDSDTPIYSCECHKTTGSAKAGQICPECGTEVRSIKADLRIIAHIDIYPYFIMTYHGLNALKKVIKPIESVYTKTAKIDAKGKLVNDGSLSIMDIYNNYDEVYYPITKLPKKYAFCSKIPVYSSKLRPFIKNGISVSVLKVNTKYQSIVTMRRDLKAIASLHGQLQAQRTLNQIQTDFIDICNHIKEQIGGKTGIIRRFMASGRIDYSSRMVIKTGPKLYPNEIEIPYTTAMIIWEEEIVNRYAITHQCSIATALKAYNKALHYYDKGFSNIFNTICRKGGGLWTFINRNPTINEKGTPLVKIKKCHGEYGDFTMDLPPDILPGLGADYDGDQLTLAAIKHTALIKYFKCFNPVYMFIDRATGYFDPAMGFKKDYIAVLSSLWRMSAAIHDFMTDPNETTVFDLKELGIDVYDPSEDQKEMRTTLYKKAMHAPKEWRNRSLIVGDAAEEYL